MNKVNPEAMDWLLHKIKSCIKRAAKNKSWRSSKSCIFQGSYDVWESAADGPMYDKIMVDRLNEARDLGFIINESGMKEWKYNENWYLTNQGELYLEEHGLTETAFD